MRQFLFVIFLFIRLDAFGQENKEIDYTLARVGQHIDGVYMFVNCEPVHPYEFITTVEANFTWKGSSIPINEQFRNIVKKCKLENSNFNAMIFRGENYNRVELIVLEGLEVSLSGFSMRDTVAFLLQNEEFIGEVVGLVPSSNMAKVKYFNVFNEQRITNIPTKQLTKLNRIQSQRLIADFQKRCEKYRFEVGDSVAWITVGFNRKVRNGVVVKLDELRHVADVSFLDDEGKAKIQAVNYINLTKQ